MQIQDGLILTSVFDRDKEKTHMMNEAPEQPVRRGRRGRRGGPHPVDIHVGSRVRMRRTLLGMSQEKLGEALGLTFQQVQKYERGANRIGSSRLYEISKILDVPIAFFFDEMADGVEAGATAEFSLDSTSGDEVFQRDPLAKRETLELVRAYYRIAEPRVRKRVFELTKAIAADGANGS
jgi:transcriptional regulator with XRE-family HTH domain